MVESTIRYVVRWTVAGAFLAAAGGFVLLNGIWFMQSKKDLSRRGPSTVPFAAPILALGAAMAVPENWARVAPLVVALLDIGTLHFFWGAWRRRGRGP